MQKVPTHRTSQQQVNPSESQVVAPFDDGTVTFAMIQALIPVALQAVEEALQRDVTAPKGLLVVLDGAKGFRATCFSTRSRCSPVSDTRARTF